jgi:hypothetical protein
VCGLGKSDYSKNPPTRLVLTKKRFSLRKQGFFLVAAEEAVSYIEASTKMDDSVNNVAQAIATALNWSSTPDARQSALSFLDSVISSSFSRSLFQFIFHFSFFFFLSF